MEALKTTSDDDVTERKFFSIALRTSKFCNRLTLVQKNWSSLLKFLKNEEKE